MVALGRTLYGVHLTFMLLGLVIVAGSIPGFGSGNAYAILAVIIAIVSWVAYGAFAAYAMGLTNAIRGGDVPDKALTWSNWLFFSVSIHSGFTGLALAFGAFIGCAPLYLSSLYLWCGLIGTVLGLLAFYLLPVLEKVCVGRNVIHHRALWVFLATGAVLVWGGIGVGLHTLLKDVVNPNDYNKSMQQYFLPYPAGESSWVVQGNNTGMDHNDSHFGQRFSWDFRLPCGTPVLAAHKGTLDIAAPNGTTDLHDGFSQGGANNQIVIDEGSTVAYYLHIQNGSLPAKFRSKTGALIAAPVKQGEEIAKVGCVGNTLTGHIHFMVRPDKSSSTASPTIGVRFSDPDVQGDGGIPRSFSSYTSSNKPTS